jgi:uncharacterized membrane protein
LQFDDIHDAEHEVRFRRRKVHMMLLVVSAILASLALGVTIAYALCLALFTLFRIHVRAQSPVRLRMQTKTVHL